MLEILNKKIISFTLSQDIYQEGDFRPLFYHSFMRQGDFYFGKNNWYATKIYQRENKEATITFFMEIESN